MLAVTIRDVIWFKRAVYSFLESCAVAPAIIIEVARQQSGGTPTIKVMHNVLDALAAKGDEGHAIAQKMLTAMHYWNDLRSIPADIVQNQRPFIGVAEIMKERP